MKHKMKHTIDHNQTEYVFNFLDYLWDIENYHLV